MPNVTLHFMAANDLNGTPLLEVTDEDDYLKAVELRIALDELGGGSVRFARKVGFALFDSGAVQPEVFVRVLVHAYSETDYFWGFFLDKREQKVIGEEGTEEFIFGGPGPKQYLDRAILTDEQFTGGGWNVDPDNGVFRFNVGSTAGRVLNRIVQEARTNPIDAIPDLTKTFNDSSDSDGDPWTNTVAVADGDFELPIGQSLLQDLWELEDVADLETRINLGSVSDRRFELQAYPSIGTDYSGGAYAADVLRFVEASSLNPNGNIGSPEGGQSLWVKGESLRRASHVLVRGKEGAYATAVRSAWSPGDYVKWASIEYARSSNPTILEAAGTRWIRRQTNTEQQIDIPIIPGTDDTQGRYFPAPDGLLWVGNTCSLFTGDVSGTPLDYRNDDFRVTGIKLTSMREASDASDALKRAMSWEVVVQLNTERGGASSPSQGTTGASSGGGSCKCRINPQLCRHGVEGDAPIVLQSHGEEANDNSINFTVDADTGGLIVVWLVHDGMSDFSCTYRSNVSDSGTDQEMTLIDTVAHPTPSSGTNTDNETLLIFYLQNPEPSAGTSGALFSYSGTPNGLVAGAWTVDSSELPEVIGATGTGTAGTVDASDVGPSDLILYAAGWRIWSLGDASNTPVNGAGLTDDWELGVNHSAGLPDSAWAGGHGVGPATYQATWATSTNWVAAAIVLPGGATEGDCPADVGEECSVGTSHRAARCDHVHAHGFHSTSGTHAHDIEQIEGLDESGLFEPQPDDPRWLLVTHNDGSGPDLVWEGDDLVEEWSSLI